MVHELVSLLQQAADPDDARVMARYFQVKPGGYGEGDVFLGVKLGRIRVLAQPWYRVPFAAGTWLELLTSEIHEHRLAALVVMSQRSERLLRGRDQESAELELIFRTYLAHTTYVDNWDLVDVSAGPVVGGYALSHDREVLNRLAGSPLVWERRIAVVSTQRLIQDGQTSDTYRLAEQLLQDQHDLIQKAVGWMLRECGKRVDEAELRGFLDAHASAMPRTMLRYAVERFPAEDRQHYLRQS